MADLVVVVAAGGGVVELPNPETISFKNPLFAYSCDMSQIMAPPKLLYFCDQLIAPLSFDPLV